MTWIKGKLSKRVRDFIDTELCHLKPCTISTYQTDLRHFQDFLCGIFHTKNISPQHIAKLTRADLQRYMVYLNKKQLAPYSRVQYLLCVRKYLAWEVKNGVVDADILEVLDRSYLPNVPQYLPKPLSAETDRRLQDLLRHSDHPHAPVFLLLRLTGLRIGELVALPRDCVLTHARNEHFLKVPLGKMDNERLVPLDQEALQLIQRIKDSYPLWHRNRSKKKLIGIDGPVQRIYPHLCLQFRNITGPLIDQGMPVTFHRLRHTYATSLLSAGVSIVSLMKLLGHKRIEMTLRYAKVAPSLLRREYLDAMGAMEKKWKVDDESAQGETTPSLDPVEMISQLRTFAEKAAVLDDHKRKIFLRRLSRLHDTMKSIDFSQNFIIHP